MSNWEDSYYIIMGIIKEYEKPRFRWRWDSLFIEGGYWSPMNYNAETIHLKKVYGFVKDNVRRFKK